MSEGELRQYALAKKQRMIVADCADSQLSVNAGHMDDPLSEMQSPVPPALVDEGEADDAVAEAEDAGDIDDD